MLHKRSNLIDRRQLIQAGAMGLAGLVSGCGAKYISTQEKKRKYNFLFIVCDQLSIDAISAYGNSNLYTPNIDRLVTGGVSFMESYSTNPVCSPARSSLFTGKMPSETGVVTNNRAIHPDIPDMGQWLRQFSYETVYCGKWHLPLGYPVKMRGFETIPVGGGQGDVVDHLVSRQCESYLLNRQADKPFLLVASFMQPHDICYWAIHNRKLVPKDLRFEVIANKLPPLPLNHNARPVAPEQLEKNSGYYGFNEIQWRYYLYIYYRQIEMLDAEVGRLLDAIESSGCADNTIVIFTSDHGEGAGKHMNVQKWYPYEEAAKVPLIFYCPGIVPSGTRDYSHLVSGLDIVPSVCDFAGVKSPENCSGHSLKPLLEGRNVPWREFVPVETHVIGRTIRTADFKYVKYKDDPVEQLFDIRNDPGETKNLYQKPEYMDIIQEHRKILTSWEKSLIRRKPTKSTHPNPPWIQRLLEIEYGPGAV